VYYVNPKPADLRSEGKKQRAKDKNESPVRVMDKMAILVAHPPLLPFALCLLPFDLRHSRLFICGL